MPHLTLQFQAGGPLLQLLVGVSQPRQQALQQAGQSIPQPISIRGLVDTGASITAVDPSVIQALGIQPTGSTTVLTGSSGATPYPTNTFDVRLLFPVAGMTFALHAMQVLELPLIALGIQALIGRDVLKNCLFVYDGRSNLFSLAF